jgi:PemK-like, MazF-like toxin of type II toxin-antitoxin system
MTTPRLTTGRIVWAEIADANGIRKLRPAVVVSPTDRLSLAGPINVVAITSRLPDPLPDDHVLLPWHPRGHPRTRLNRRCAAVCTWLGQITEGGRSGRGRHRPHGGIERDPHQGSCGLESADPAGYGKFTAKCSLERSAGRAPP